VSIKINFVSNNIHVLLYDLQVLGMRQQVNYTQSVDTAQLHQSRLGLVSQAVMLIITVCFILSEILGEFWKKKVPLESRNLFDVVFRVVELGVALWFPCVLWNCMRWALLTISSRTFLTVLFPPFQTWTTMDIEPKENSQATRHCVVDGTRIA